ncbi:RNA polymerase sigma factor [Clostridium intestinale]|uniref:ECF subfamily RNA polymerase sigma-24 subunit n=1 Tax=Clostridium intestinale URNW TaxID=1294142 RepID=U2NN26_9CLOT|nr:RNA polymerase sigma factor [Clostridium intestinale]ERK30563.1 ECF subfamily RNA polymerase sigma-24 subunit [Clostridium intestinale URNW]
MNIEKLVKKATKGNKDAFVELMKIYERDMYNLTRYMLGNNEATYDVVQDTILTVYEKISTLKNPSSFKSWLLKIVVNKSKSELSKQNKIIYLENSIEIPIIDKDLEKIELMSLVSNLPDDFKSVIILFYFNDLSYKEISEILDIPEGTVKSRLFRGKEILHKIIYMEEDKANGKG